MIKVRYKKSSKNNKIRCEICANYCKISDGKFGICKQFKNVGGDMVDIGYGIISAVNVDPIEKKPLARFLPGTMTYSLGGFGCNMGCLHCQNTVFHRNMMNFHHPSKCFQKRLWKMQSTITANQ